ncbi:MAG TPA: AMP-binding protein [Propylenella sp.]|nr:AMP-binding protein [Propylenella sp.]
MIHYPQVETRPWAEQHGADELLYRAQIGYLLAHSRFYREKLTAAGYTAAEAVGGLAHIQELPFTEKDELRGARSDAEPIGPHLAAPLGSVVRIFSTSGTTGTPTYIPLSAADLAGWVRISSRSYSASGIERGDALVSTYNAGPFVAGATLDAFAALGLRHIPVGSGNTERLMAAVRLLKPDAVALTPSYALHLAEWSRERGFDLAGSSVKRLLVAGEPGGGEPAMRARLEEAWGAKVTEAMGIGDIAVSLWGECEAQQGMHFSGRGLVHFELIEPHSGKPLPLIDGATGELVYTHLRREAAPLLRFRSRDHVVLRTGVCACGRTAPRIRCVGRTDDMLIVRGVNVFPSAVRDVVNRFGPALSGPISIRPSRRGFRQDPPLKVLVELGEGEGGGEAFAAAIRQEIRDVLLVTTEIVLVPFGTLPRSDYKSKLVDWSEAPAE